MKKALFMDISMNEACEINCETLITYIPWKTHVRRRCRSRNCAFIYCHNKMLFSVVIFAASIVAFASPSRYQDEKNRAYTYLNMTVL